MQMLCALMQQVQVCMPTRTLWVTERSFQWWERVVNETFTENDWIANFRMSRRSTFIYLCNQLRLEIEKQDRPSLWLMATNSDFRTIGHLFCSIRGICV